MSDKKPSTFDFGKFDGQEWGMTGDESRNVLLNRSLVEQREQTKLLKKIKESTALERYEEPREIVVNSEFVDDREIYVDTTVDTSGITDDLLPELETLVDGQAEMIGELAVIGVGLASVAADVSDISQELDDINDTLNLGFERVEDALYDVRDGIDDLADEVAMNTRAVIDGNKELVSAIQDSQALAYWMHTKEMAVRHSQLQALQNPRRTAATEAWQIGEECRRKGNKRDAIKMFAESLKANPAETKNYISLGQVFLEAGDISKAKKYLARGVKFAVELDQQSLLLLGLAKIEMAVNNHKQAKDLLEMALKADVSNLDVWFDLAICEIKLGNLEQALDYVNNLLHLKPQIASHYAEKLFSEVEFKPLWGQIRQIIQEIINNQ